MNGISLSINAFLLILALLPGHALSQAGPTFSLILDPGHGGVDAGVEIGGNQEKQAVLGVARRIEELLSERTDLRVILTRRDDYDVPWDERRRVANTNGPGLFLSLHLSASSEPELRATQLFVLSSTLGGRSPSPLGLFRGHLSAGTDSVRWGMALRTSLEPALGLKATLHSATIPLAPLLGVTIPAVLVELDRPSPEDGPIWTQEEQITKTAQAIIAAVDAYRSPPPTPGN